MKLNRFTVPLVAVAFAFGLAPAAHASTFEEVESTTYGFYSAMTDIFSCRYYPTRPWCPNPTAHIH
ncbi:hypothetical protein [Corynebacterium sp. H130]|uniref:hypothetical protein n=1 Tax=Corynebacterium sp. H130 TaxID=3133444 RepID=UPI0030A2F346